MSLETKEKILDTAEQLFGEQGVEATSLRNVIAAAGVNLAAIHYHFHNKESLLDALLLRKLTIVNRERMQMLDRFESETGGKPSVEQIIDALLRPAFAMSERHPQFVRLMGRLQVEEVMPRLMAQHFPEVLARFFEAFRTALPHLGSEELMWRMHFTVGSIGRAMRGGAQARFAHRTTAPLSAMQICDRLVVFLAAGFRAPVPEDK